MQRLAAKNERAFWRDIDNSSTSINVWVTDVQVIYNLYTFDAGHHNCRSHSSSICFGTYKDSGLDNVFILFITIYYYKVNNRCKSLVYNVTRIGITNN